MDVEKPTPPNPDELRRCAAVLQAIAHDRALLAPLSRDERIALLTAAGQVSYPSSRDKKHLARAERRQQRQAAREADKKARASTVIRQSRQVPVYQAPAPDPQRLLDTASRKSSGTSNAESHAAMLQNPRHCYVCKVEFRHLHFFYDSMCQDCGDLNYHKRFQSADVRGRIAVITGARVKIGYQAALILLRAGARVLVTTRFPHDAALRFAREADFAAWGDRLEVYGLDLRHAPSVELFCRYLDRHLPYLDFLINNAAQTVRRPPGFYAHMNELEAMAPASLPVQALQVLGCYHQLCANLSEMHPALGAPAAASPASMNGMLAQIQGGSDGLPGVGIRASAALSQLPYRFDPIEAAEAVFPVGRLDADLQQVDLRTVNSWRLALADVPVPEMLEVQLVNSVAPFILCAKLKPLMLRANTFDRHIVNVSAMEGKFSRHTKTDKHPHTNMAKAALNMLTLTSASDYARSGIHMNAVDTGWVTDEDPATHAMRKQDEIDFHPPLDIVDGAARILDPIFCGLNSKQHSSGKFFKDYGPTDW